LVVLPAGAADFRALNFGDSCVDVDKREAALGSVAGPHNHQEGTTGTYDIYEFQVREFERDLHITYFCRNGALLTGNYYFPLEPLETAARSFRDTYQYFESGYGVASADTTPWGSGGLKHWPVASNPAKYTTYWESANLMATMSIQPNHPEEPSGWRVFIVVRKKQE
jgi:hypothetical protein